MKSLLVLALISLSLCAMDLEKHKKIAYHVNKLRTTWKAKEVPTDLEGLLGTFLEGAPKTLPRKTKFRTNVKDLPESFDLREAYPNCETLREIRDQSKCGSCWAFGGAEAMSDRLCIHSNQTLQTRVSAQDLVTCCYDCGFGCQGGWPIMTFYYWQEHGIPSGGLYGDKNSCKPYFLPPCKDHMHNCTDYQDTPECEDKCQEGYPKTPEEDATFGVSAYSVGGEEDMMQEIFENGSVEGAFTVYEDFADYESGIYQHVTGSMLGGHAIKIIGWGVENNVKYWLIANSWGDSWGEKGYFRMLKGENECGIEDEADTGMPLLEKEGRKFLE